MSEALTGVGALLGAAGVSLLMVVGSIALIVAFVTRIPADYFSRSEPPPSPFAHRHPGVALALRIARSVVGLVLIVAGLAMLVLPGQGLLTILIGLLLLEFPGKRRIELALVRRPQIAEALNWLRRKTGHPPLEPPATA